MKEIIEFISEDTFNFKDDYDTYEGYIIKTNKQSIKIGISNYQSCCEYFGYLTTNDSLEYFIGAAVFDIKLTDTSLNTKMIKEEFQYGFDGGDIQFVNIETDKGTLQLAVYNSHNGYYGHSIVIRSNRLNYDGGL